MFHIENRIWKLGEYLEYICGNDTAVGTPNDFDIKFGNEIRTYLLEDIGRCIIDGGNFVIVEFPHCGYGCSYNSYYVFELKRSKKYCED